jgi:hypothetical protein
MLRKPASLRNQLGLAAVVIAAVFVGEAKQFDNSIVDFGGINGLKSHDAESEWKIATATLGLKLYPILQRGH